MTDLTHILDANGLYALKLDYTQGTLRVSLADQGQPWPRFRENITRALKVGGHPGTPNADGSLTFNNITFPIRLQCGNETIGTYDAQADGLTPIRTRPLTSSETRRIGTFFEAGPYAQKDAALVAKAKRSVFTDLHTHSSGQITANGLIEVGVKHDAEYPLHLLEEAGINISHFKNVKTVPRVEFPPLEPQDLPPQVKAVSLKELTDDERKKLALKMNMRADKQSTYTEMEYDAYRFRYPLTKITEPPEKAKAIFIDSWKKVAKEYKAQGITYAEIAMVGLDNPSLLASMHEAMRAIEQDPTTQDVKLRFMVGIPRNWPIERIHDTLEKTKILADSPYVIGVDFIGYEVNKTKDFQTELNAFAKEMDRTHAGFTLRMHAGENDKNLENVSDFLKLVKKFHNLRARIGHGIYGMDEGTLNLAGSLGHRLTFEYNPASNIALNNIDDVKQLPFQAALKHNVPFILGSDGSGIYQTDAAQLGLDAYYAGLTSEGFDKLHAYQTALVAKQNDYAHRLSSRIPGWQHDRKPFLDQLTARIKAYKPTDIKPVAKAAPDIIAAKLKQDGVVMTEPGKLPAALQGLTPITIVGASGTSWTRIDAKHQHETTIMVDMLAHALSPDKTYFVHGRTKKEGLSQAVINAIEHGNKKGADEKRRPFLSLGILAEPSFDEDISYKHLHFMERIKGSRLDLADALVDHTIKHQGMIIGAGGAAFTRDIILKADLRGMRASGPENKKMMLLYTGAKGAAADKARSLDPMYQAPDAKTVISKLYERRPDLFNDDFKIDKLDSYYEKSDKRVQSYQYDKPSPKDQRVKAAVRVDIEPDKGKS